MNDGYQSVTDMICRESDTWGERKLFNFNPAAPFQKGSGWLAWALIGLALAPLVVGATVTLVSLVGYEQAVAEGRGTVDGVAGMISMDGATYLRLLAVTGEASVQSNPKT
jgi:hypothetical protein